MNENEKSMLSHDEGAYHRLSPKVLIYWRLSALFSCIIIAAVLMVAFIFGYPLLVDFPYANYLQLAMIIASALIVLSMFFRLVILPSMAYKRWLYLLTRDRFEFRRGIIFHKQDIVPIARIQNATINEGPIQRLLGIASLTVMTAGNSVVVSGLSAQVARDVGDAMKTAINRKVLEAVASDLSKDASSGKGGAT